MLRFAVVLAVCLAVASGKMRVGPRPHFMLGRPDLAPVEEDDSKIVGGSEVTAHSIPYQASFQYDFGGNDFFHFCGGIVYNENYVITAAHCCEGQNPGGVQVALGEHNLFATDGDEYKVGVSEIIIHEDYGVFSYSNDICLLRTSGPIMMGDTVAPVPLPRQGQQFEAGSTATVSGWGTLSSGGTPDVLHSVDVPVVDDQTCEDAYGSSMVPETMICSGAEGIDSCQGDSGGPMTCEGPLCGIVSWGRGCGLDGYPGVYAEASAYVDWMAENAV